MTERQIIKTDGAPTPTGPFNQAIRVGNLVYTSGQAGRNRDTGQMGVDADAAAGLHDPLEGGAAADVAVDLVATWAGGHRRGRRNQTDGGEHQEKSGGNERDGRGESHHTA